MNNMIVGMLLSAISQMVDVAPSSNAVAYMPNDLTEVTLFLNEADRLSLMPVIVIDKYYIDSYGRYSHVNPEPLKEAIRNSNHIGRIAFMSDEPCWRGRNNGFQTCSEIISILENIQEDFSGVEFVHIEAFAELYFQKQENNGRLTLMTTANHIGFDCYGAFSSCGDPSIGVPNLHQMDYIIDIYSEIMLSGSKAKIFLVPGTFIGDGFFNTEYEVIEQLEDYELIANIYGSLISGFGGFIWGDYNGNGKGLIGAENLPLVKEKTLEILNSLK